MAAKVCLLTDAETYALETYAVIPDCSRHLHLTNKQANTLEKHKDIEHRTVRRVQNKQVADGRRRIVLESGRAWQKVTPDSGPHSKGFAGMQLVAKRAGYIPMPPKVMGATRARHGETQVIMKDGVELEIHGGPVVAEDGELIAPVLA